MPNQEPSYISEDQPEQTSCYICHVPLYTMPDGRIIAQGIAGDHVHQIDRRLPENAAKRKEVGEYLESKRDN